MAPTPQENRIPRSYDGQQKKFITRPLAGDEVVISGMSGIFPSSDSVQAFSDNLYNKVDMVAADIGRWVFNHPEVPVHLGKVNGMGKFDAQFFRVHFRQGLTMEPMSRKLLEHAYSAIYDSGINTEKLRGKKTGVFIGSTFSESEQVVIYKNIQRNGFGITGCNKAMYANRISYWIDGKGPSYALDLACSSAMACLEHAYRSISSGQCDAAIVGGCNLCMHPCVSLNLRRAGFLSLDGKTRSFDKNGDGYVRADSISVLFVQKAKDALRIYAEVYHAKGNYGLTVNDAEFKPVRASEDIKSFMESFYSEIDVSPRDVEFVEAHGSGIAEADANELEAIGQVFAKDRSVLVGSVKSNMGHSEPASGCCSVTKALLAFEKGAIPPNLHYEQPQDQISAVKEGRIQVVQDVTPFNRNFIAINSFSYTGANLHVLLKGHYKPKDLQRYKSSIPRLVTVSGRQDSSVQKILGKLLNQPLDAEQIGLLHSIHSSEIPGHMSRGYVIFENNDEKDIPVVLTKHVEYFSGITRPIWFCYSGMGSQWAGMGAELMKIPIFAAAIEKCRKVLEPKGIDIVHILTHTDKKIYDNILHSFVGIAAVQIGITDILKAMGIVPDNIIGHSVGELGCAYADGCFTAEEMILAAYSRGLVSVQTPFIRGSMAAVGLGYKTILPLCPPEIEVACHNSSESATISGPAEVMKEFVADLTSKGIFAKEVPCSNIAYHSRYIAGAGPGLLKYLSEVITDPKPRSEKWVSTSVPEENWNEPIAKFSSAEYHTNNLLNAVLFEETSKMIPSNAIVIEIAPHGLLQAILKRSLTECIHVPLTRRGHADPVKFFLESIGTLYETGLNPDLSALYPKIEFPVSTGTPLLSHLVEWEHSENWPQANYNSMDRVTAAVRNFVVSIHDDDYKYLEGYMRNGLIVLPEAAILVLVWETMAMQKGQKMDNMSVSFTNVNFKDEVVVIQKEKPLRIGMMIHKGNNHFEVHHDGVAIVSGFVQEITEEDLKLPQVEPPQYDEDEVTLTGKDIYNLMHQKGYVLGEDFRSICSAGSNRTTAQIKWSSNWISFIDSLIQFTAFSRDYEGISLPKVIKKLVINLEAQDKMDHITDRTDAKCYAAIVNNVMQTSQCGGVQIHGMILKDQPLVEDSPDLLVSRDFVPHFPVAEVSVETVVNLFLQIVQDNVSEDLVNVTDFTKPAYQMSNIISYVSDSLPSTIEVKSVQNENVDFDVLVTRDPSIKESNIFVVDDLLGNERKMQNLHQVTANNTFVLTWERNTTKLEIKYKYFNIISVVRTQSHIAVLLKKTLEKIEDNVIYIPVAHDENFSWYPRVQTELQKARKVILVSERQPLCGLYGLVKSLRKEHGDKIGLVVIADFCGPTFNPEKDIFKEYLQKNLTFNIMRNGQWGGFYNAPCAMTSKSPNITLTSSVPGNLDSLTWVEAEQSQSGHSLVQVCYAAPSYRDAQKAAGKILNDEKVYGMDFSGIDNKGEKVMGLIEGGSIASTVKANSDLLWPVPAHWTLEDAATVPLPYVHAYYLLAERIALLDGHKVFVHGGAGALGQAVISICLGLKCSVYTTVSDMHKKRFLMRLFPDLDEKNIGNSRDVSFVPMVLSNTNNEGCNIVINCAGGDIRNAAMQCTASSGFFLDCNDGDMIDNSDFGMAFLSREKNYRGVNLTNIFKPEHQRERINLQMLISEGIKKGLVRPLSRVVYSPIDVSRAFRLLSLSRHRGRAVIRIWDPVTSSSGLEVVPRMIYSPEHSYLVVVDGNIFGLELADRLIRRGARNLMIHVKANTIDGYFCTKMASWRKLDVNVKISNENIQTEKGCVSLLTDLAKLGPVQGIFVAQPSNPNTKRTVTQADFVTKFSDTTLIVANLDSVSRNLCSELSYFVVVTQSSDNRTVAFTNSASERICLERAETGFPALFYQIGRLAEFDTNSDDSNSTKVAPQSLKAAFNALEASLKLKYRDISSHKFIHNPTKFMDKVMRILGITGVKNIPDSTSLNDLRISEVILEEIKTAIKEETGMIYHNAKVAEMTIADLKRVGGKHETTKFDSGLGAFYTYIDVDECMATEPMVVMPTKCSNATENEDELDSKAPYLMLIPGFEGHHQIYTSITERLKIEALTFQLAPDMDFDSIPELALNIRTFMKKRFELKSKFYLMGYSFGVNVALELAALMEKEGHVGVVFCLDSSPDALRVQLDAYLGNLTDEQLQNAIVEHMYRLMSGKEDSSEKFKTDLSKCDTWSQKVEACVRNVKGMVTYSHQYIKYLLGTAYKRISLARSYVPLNLKLESKIVLMRGIQHPKGDVLPNDYYLSKYTKQPVDIFDLKSDHAMSPQECSVSNVINYNLDSTILADFLNKNVCETYLADPFKII